MYGYTPGYWGITAQVCTNIHRVFQALATEQKINCNGKCQAADITERVRRIHKYYLGGQMGRHKQVVVYIIQRPKFGEVDA